MERSDILSKLQEILADIIDSESLKLTENDSPNTIEDWDSLAHFQFVMELQDEYGIKFNALEIQSWKSVKDIIDSILSKQP